MAAANEAVVLLVDSDQNEIAFVEYLLHRAGSQVIVLSGTTEKSKLSFSEWPSFLLLSDENLPDYTRLEKEVPSHDDLEFSQVPVVLISSTADEPDEAKRKKYHIIDVLHRPLEEKALLELLARQLKVNVQPLLGSKTATPRGARSGQEQAVFNFNTFYVDQINLFQQLKEELLARQPPGDVDAARILKVRAGGLYAIPSLLNMTTRQLAKTVATFLKLPFTPVINHEDVLRDVLPRQFCTRHSVVVVRDEESRPAFVLTNPFDFELLDVLKRTAHPNDPHLIITEPSTIDTIFNQSLAPAEEVGAHETIRIVTRTENSLLDPEIALEQNSITSLADGLLSDAIRERASDVHLEPKGATTTVRIRVDGDLREHLTLVQKSGAMVISRLKAIAGMDIAEQRKPQDGAVEAIIDNRQFLFRLATSSTPYGESLVIRILEPSARVKPLSELGIPDPIVKRLTILSHRTSGLILMVGPTGSGKTTTIYSLLSLIDCRTRSLISVEDPVEYRIPLANQQEVNIKAGVTFQALLKSAVRQDPDILYVGEIRDDYSARIALDTASTGHLCFSTLHTVNSTTAIFRLERLEITRGQMADGVLCIIAQRLLKTLCTYCKKIDPISPEERAMLVAHTDEPPEYIAHPVGCVKCNHTGYLGREGVYEMIEFDRTLADMVRSDLPIPEIRKYIRNNGGQLMSNNALDKVRRLICPPQDIYHTFLAEELNLEDSSTLDESSLRKPHVIPVEEPAAPIPAPLPEPPALHVYEDAGVHDRMHDQLTGLPTKQKFFAIAEHQVRLARRIKAPLTILYIVLENLQEISESVGAEQADRALRDAAALLNANFRDSDVVARLSDNLFAALAWGTSGEGADICVRRLREKVERQNSFGSRRYRLVFSIGAANFNPGAPQTIDELLAIAELQVTERRGANRVA